VTAARGLSLVSSAGLDRKLARKIATDGAIAMTVATLALGLIVGNASAAPPIEPAHAGNDLYRRLHDDGWTAAGAHVTFPAPALTDRMAADDERAALRAIAGSDRDVAELTRDSVTAPFILKTHDLEAGDALIRQADLWFVVRAGLDAINPDKLAAGAGEGQPVEAGNMRFSGRRLGADDLAGHNLPPQGQHAEMREWFVHLTGRLLDRLHVEATDRITATRSDDSWVIASLTDPRFDQDRSFPNRWWPIAKRGGSEEAGTAATYAGGASYVKISRLSTVAGGLMVEAHFAFFEPKPWFDGAPILRSKIGVVAQDRIRGLRRELAKSQKGQGARSTGTAGPHGR
jgi:hypothetical protein